MLIAAFVLWNFDAARAEQTADEPYTYAVWPEDEDDPTPVPTEPVLWVTAHDEPFAPILTVASTGETVPVVVHNPSGELYAVIPEAPLVASERYTLSADDGETIEELVTFVVTDHVPVVPQPPVAWRRTLTVGNAIPWYEPGRYESSAQHDLCTTGVVTLSIAADVEPEHPTTFDSLGALLGPLSWAWHPVGDGCPGATTTVWFGSFGADGTFSGWGADEVTLPDVWGSARTDTRGCDGGDWQLGDLTTGLEPDDVDTVCVLPEGPDQALWPDSDRMEGECGCRSARAPSWLAGAAATLLLLARRRKAKAVGEGQRCRRPFVPRGQ